MTTPVTVSAPGKIHFIGEHTVVYGKPALLAAINKRVRVTIQYQQAKTSSRHHTIHGLAAEAHPFLFHAIQVFQQSAGVTDLPLVDITVASDIPFGAGLGSSAALAVATIGALLRLVKGVWHPARIHEWAFEVEKYAHGNPSGADVTVVAYGGLVWFRKEFPFLKSIWSLPLQQYHFPPLVLIDSGKPAETTKEMVEHVAGLVTKEAGAMELIFSDQEKQAKRLVLALREEDYQEVAACMVQAQRNLEALGVVGQRAREIVQTIERSGGAAKISGAGGVKGGSGMLLCYHPDMQKLKKLANTHQWPILSIVPGEEGVRIEKHVS